MSIIPIAAAAQLVPAALVAGRVATNAIGSFAEMLRDAVDSPSQTPSVASETAKPDGLPAGITTLLRDFASAFNRLLQNHNLDTSSPVQLRLGDAGDVEVTGGHPQASAIESLLAQTPSLSELFRNLAAQATAHRKEQEFAAFQENSHSPAEDFPLLFSNAHAPRFQLAIHGENSTPAFVQP